MKKLSALLMSMILGIGIVGCSSINEDEEVATVNGVAITFGNYENVLALEKQSIEAYYGDTIWEQEVEDGVLYKDKFKELVLDQMVYTELIYQEAKKENILPTEKEVETAISNFKTSIESNEEYQKQLKEIGIDDEFLKYQFSRELASENYKVYYDKNNNVDDKSMQTYYDENKDEFYVDEVRASHILIKTIDDENNELSDEKKAEAKEKAKEVLAKVKSGEDFATLAKEYSEDTGSAVNGGDLDFFPRGYMVEPFENAAFSMKVGEVSDLVESNFGYHIIKVTDKVDEQKTFDEVKDEIKSTLQNENYNAQIENLKSSANVETNKEILNKIKVN